MSRRVVVPTVLLWSAIACEGSLTAPNPGGPLVAPHAAVSPTGLLLDTGPGASTTIGWPSLFSLGSTTCSPQPVCASNVQHLGGRFTLTAPATTESVEGWMSVASPGDLAVVVRADAGGVPRAVVHVQTYPVATRGIGWERFPAYRATLGVGAYWLSFEPVAYAGFAGAMPGGAAVPLSDYAFFANGNNRWVPFSLFGQNPGLGVRLESAMTPAERIGALQAAIRGLQINLGIATSLNAKLSSALAFLAAGDAPAACASLGDFTNQVTALAGRQLSAVDARTLLTESAVIQGALGC